MSEQHAEQREVPETTHTMGDAMTHYDNSNSNQGPLKFLRTPPDAKAARVVTEKLFGHASAANWIKEGLSPELDALRSEHLRVRAQVIDDDRTVAELEARWKAEDAEHEERLRQAHREGKPDSVEDRRTPVEQREAEHARAVERYWAGVRVLGERADAIRAYFAEHETELLAGLRHRVAPAQEKRREAQRLQDAADTELWHIAQLGRWVQTNRDARGAVGAQPVPVPSPPPRQFTEEKLEQMLDHALERPYYREAPVVAWQDQQPADAGDDDKSARDATGAVSELVETDEGAAS